MGMLTIPSVSPISASMSLGKELNSSLKCCPTKLQFQPHHTPSIIEGQGACEPLIFLTSFQKPLVSFVINFLVNASRLSSFSCFLIYLIAHLLLAFDSLWASKIGPCLGFPASFQAIKFSLDISCNSLTC